jgi:hypothetical protein
MRTAISDADVVGDGLILFQSGFEVFFRVFSKVHRRSALRFTAIET